jgi:hypothetical protein
LQAVAPDARAQLRENLLGGGGGADASHLQRERVIESIIYDELLS